ncbi:MAG: acyl-CoA thioesterase [Corynebacterium sp.]|nr:acyl-CoA thioesterase [Corynebacterium sp.]
MSRAPENCFTTVLDVRWSDQDLNGHVNNAQVLTLVEEARVRAVLSWSGTSPDPTTPRVVRALNTLYDDELLYGSLLARVWISRIGTTSYTVCHELFQENRPCVYAEAVIVVLDRETRSPTPISTELRAQLEPHQAVYL